jgi:hypothetical protein
MMVAATIALTAAPSFGIGAATVSFLNPSSYAIAGEKGIIVSDAAPDSGPGCCDGTGAGYHLSAWVANAPPDSRVFFSVVQRSVDLEITDTQSTDNATWETNWRIPDEVVDGPATLRAHLVLNEQQIAVDEVDVTILRSQDNAQIRYPGADGKFGIYAALADALPEKGAATRTPPTGVIDALFSEGPDIDRLRAFYTTSLPGTDPKWKVCGEEGVSSAANGVRCDLASAADQGNVTAVATITNDTPAPGPFDARQNGSGDAVAVLDNYAQVPTNFSLVTAGDQKVDREMDRYFPCSDGETVKLTDQVGRPVAGANIDVHATGPSDSLKFDHEVLEVFTDVAAPDRGSHAIEEAYDCITDPLNSDPYDQGEHQRFGAPDRKHVETLPGGTTDVGTLTFALHATVEGVTDWTAWVDETDDGCLTNDDAFTQGEMFVSGAIGWGESPGLPIPQPYELFVACTPGVGPSPSPSPTDEPQPLDGSRTITLQLNQTPVVGKPMKMNGRINAARAECENNQLVVLKMRRPDRKYWVASRTRTDASGRYSISAMARSPRDYRAVARKSTGCDKAVSDPIMLRAH